jgi:clan AA aspartic protease
MIKGRVNESYEATVKLNLLDATGEDREIEAIIDTGYNGYLTLPTALIEVMGLPWQGQNEVLLADGTSRVLDVYDGIVSWNGRERPIYVDAIDTETLVGMGLLRGYGLRVDVVRDGMVAIEALS